MTPDSEYDKVLQQYTWTILVLLYFAACDGAIKLPERRVIIEYFKRRNPDHELDSGKIEFMIGLFGRPDKTTFHKLVRERDAEPFLLQDIYETALAVIATNSKLHSEQERAVEYLRKSWKGRIAV